jgi:hypothetical protein
MGAGWLPWLLWLVLGTLEVSVCCRGDGRIPPDLALHWAESIGGLNDEQANAVAVDASGMAHVVGYFQEGAHADTLSLTNVGNWDAYIAVFDSDHTVLWARSGGGVDQDNALGVAVDDAGNSYVAGCYRRTASFGSLVLTNAGGSDAFVAKYDPVGQLLWVRRLGGTGDDCAFAITSDPAGNTCVSGFFTAAMTTDAGVVSGHAPSADLFLARFDPEGNLVWVRSGGGTGPDVTGSFADKASLGDADLSALGNVDVFLAKYSAAGDLLWARSMGGTNADVGYGVAAVSGGGVVLTGTFVKSGTFETTILTNTGTATFTARYDAAGGLVWVRATGGFEATGRAVVVSQDDALVAGHFQGTGTFGTNRLVSAGTYDLFLADYSASTGELNWVRAFGGETFERAFGLAGDAERGLFVAGAFGGAVSFDGVPLVYHDRNDAFVAKLAPAPVMRSQPVGLTVVPNSHVTFSVVAAGAQPLFYQWYRDETVPVAGATNATLDIARADLSSRGRYHAVVTNRFGSVRSLPANLVLFGLAPPLVRVEGEAASAFDFTNRTSVAVSIEAEPVDAAIYYTLDGSPPTFRSLPYRGAFVLDRSATVRAIAVDATSASAQTDPVPVQLHVTPPGVSIGGLVSTNFSFTNIVSRTVSLVPGVPGLTIHYTLDGTTPTLSNGLTYRTPFVLTNTTTVRATTIAPGLDVLADTPALVHFYWFYPVVLIPPVDGLVNRLPAPGPDDMYLSESVVQFVAKSVPGSGWTFLRWTGAISGTDAVAQVRVDGPLRVGALFGTPLSVTNFGEGTVVLKPADAAYSRGAVVQAFATPARGNYLAEWGGVGHGTANPLTFTIDGPVPILSSRFLPLPANYFSVTVTPGDGGVVTGGPSRPYVTNGETVTLTAVPDGGRVFGKWTGDIQSTANPLTVVVSNNLVLGVEFPLMPRLEQTLFQVSIVTNKVDNEELHRTNTVFQFRVNGGTGNVFLVLVSTNTVGSADWTALRRITNTSGYDLVVHSNAILGAAWYRLTTP